jgi:hypothetical protein
MTTQEFLQIYFNHTPPKPKTILERLDKITSLVEDIKTFLPSEVTDLELFAEDLEDEATQLLFQIQDLLKAKTNI